MSFVFSVLLAFSLSLVGCATQRMPVVKLPYIDFSKAGCKPEYPRAALRDEQQGTVNLVVQVDVDGSISGVDIEKSSSFPLLDNAIRDRLLAGECKGEPGTVDGRVQILKRKVQYVWKLD
ncbi:MAG: TonB family protein [Burkholderiales bacterium]|nr:TonB family protein [Burkholderiales bacterium]